MKLKRRKMKRGRVEIIPMIDTIVILLVFYMSFARVAQMAKEEVELPDALSGMDIEEELNKVIINMPAADKLRIGGNDYKVSELTQLLKQEKAKNPKISITARRQGHDVQRPQRFDDRVRQGGYCRRDVCDL